VLLNKNKKYIKQKTKQKIYKMKNHKKFPVRALVRVHSFLVHPSMAPPTNTTKHKRKGRLRKGHGVCNPIDIVLALMA
jgi:hypothetical protein